MMDDIGEQNEIAEEISTALSAPIGFAAELDEVCGRVVEFAVDIHLRNYANSDHISYFVG